MTGWGSYLAMGDSFTEGLDDPGPAGGYRGWADRFAEHLAASRPDLRYANLAVRGKLLRQIISEQLPVALAARPELVSLAGGGNDLLRPGVDLDSVAALFDDAVAQLRGVGGHVVLFTGADPGNRPVLRRLRGKIVKFNQLLRDIGDRHGCTVVDMWRLPALADVRAWSADRLHLSAEGHRRVALYTCEQLGVATDGDSRAPWPPAQPLAWWAQRYDDVRWTKDHLVPWIARRLRGQSSGDGLQAKRPQLHPL
jgi:lysophospholipase L1-like esterase